MSNRVTVRTVRVAATAAVMLLVVVGPARAGTGDEPPEFHRDPGKGIPGTIVTVSGRGCSLDGQPAQRANVNLRRQAGIAGGPMCVAGQGYPVAADGSWDGTFTVPSDAPPGPYDIEASCSASDMSWNRTTTDFEVLDPAAPTTTVAPPPPTTTVPRPPPSTTAVPATTVPETVAVPPSTDTSLAVATRPPRDDPPDRPGDSSVAPAAIAAIAILVGTAGAVAVRRRHRAPAT